MKKIILLSLALISLNAKDFKYGARVSLDAGYIDNSIDSYSDSEVRRFRLYVKGKFLEDFKYEAEYDTVSKNGFKDLYIAYYLMPNLNIKIGQTKEPFGLENLTSSKYESFLEDSLISTFSNKRRVGLTLNNSYLCNNHNFTTSIGYFTDSINDMLDDETYNTSTYSSRFTYSFTPQKKSVYHIGLSLSQSDFDPHKIKYKTKLNSHLYRGSVLKSKIKYSDKIQRYQIEAAYEYNSFTFMGEYGKSKVYALNDYEFDGWYAQVSYFLTGEHRRYKKRQALFKGIKPKSKFSLNSRGTGAIEVALRVSSIDLTKADFKPKEEVDTTIGLNWYINNNLRLLTNYTNANIKNSDDEYSINTRLEYMF